MVEIRWSETTQKNAQKLPKVLVLEHIEKKRSLRVRRFLKRRQIENANDYYLKRWCFYLYYKISYKDEI